MPGQAGEGRGRSSCEFLRWFLQRRLRRCIDCDFGRLPDLVDYFVAGAPAIVSDNDNPGFIHHHVISFMDGLHVNQMFVC